MNGIIPALPISNYYDLLQQLGISQVPEEKWVELVMKKENLAGFEKTVSSIDLAHVTCYGFRMIIKEWMNLCGYHANEQVLHIVITRLFQFLKDSNGFVNVMNNSLYDK